MRAVAQDETGAQMAGIGLNRIFMLTLGLIMRPGGPRRRGAAVRCYPSSPDVGLQPLYLAWYVVILAGLGNVQGAIAGAFIVALLQTLAGVLRRPRLGGRPADRDHHPHPAVQAIGPVRQRSERRLGAVVATEAASTTAARAVVDEVRARSRVTSPSVARVVAWHSSCR